MKVALKYLFIVSLIIGFWTLIWAGNGNASISPDDWFFSPPDSTQSGTGDTSKTSSEELPFPFNDFDGLTPAPGQESPLFLNNPSNIESTVDYNPETNEYEFEDKVGNMYYRYPRTMTLQEYRDYDFKKGINDYWRQRTKSESFSTKRSAIPKLHVGGEIFDRIFGSNTIDIKPQGSAELRFGMNITKIDNPQLSERLRKTWTFDFNERIQMNVTGQIGDKLKLEASYNTEASFDFENKMNLSYEGKEDEIIQKIEAGDVTLPLTGSLITGSQSLFGIKTELQFGKLTATTVFSQQKGKTQVIEVEGGAQTNYFEVYCDDYEANKHFFLAQYFRDNYNRALEELPYINSDINITKVEVWVTNKTASYEESRNILALMDVGEGYNSNGESNVYASSLVVPQVGTGVPRNDINSLYSTMVNTYSGIRDFSSITSILSGLSSNGFVGGQDYEKIESARKLSPSEYKLNERLGYITVNSSLNADEILAVAFEYTYRGDGRTYRVGEFSQDVSSPQTLVVKLLKGTSLTPRLPTWKLMMKNVYALGAYQVNQDDFYLNVFYNNPKTGTPINYIPDGVVNKIPLIEVLNLDNLNSQLERNSDGIFDFIEGVTIMSSNGRVFFPVLEPFGNDLEEKFEVPEIANKYVFHELYDSTQSIARQIAEKNKFLIKGSYQSASGSDIALNALNVPQGSVVVTAGGRQLAENVDYTVDYTLGRVKIINQGLLESGTPIKISLESNSLFSIQSKTLLGTHLNYQVSKDFTIGGTILNLTERPLTQKVNIGDEPISNTIWGLDGTYRSDVPFLTKLVDKLPFLETKEMSSITVNGEFAHLIPGHSKAIEKEGIAYIDDFEGSKTSLDIKSVSAWKLASTPQGQNSLFRGGDRINSLEYGYSRARLAWYVVDPVLVRSESGTPETITDDEKSNHFVREIFEQEIFPNKDTYTGVPTNIPVLNLAYYPQEKGPYNYNVAELDSAGNLSNPEERWGGIMRKIETNDFEAANIEFIEFWMMDPFADPDNDGPAQPINTTGGYLYFNLGNVSEDILKDGRKTFENGLPTTNLVELVDTTIWGRVPLKQSMVNAFDNNPESRQYQDVGLDGLNDDSERDFFGGGVHNYLDTLLEIYGSTSVVYQKALQDPSNDNFHYFRGTDFDNSPTTANNILERYKWFNGTDGNSPTSDQSEEQYPTQGTNLPDVEDINRDNNLSENESYFQYRIPIYPDMEVGNGFITDKIEKEVELMNGELGSVPWYQFKIPIQNPDTTIGSIDDFKSIRFVRLLMQGWQEKAVLRFASLDLVRGEWRKYKYALREAGEWSADDQISGGFDITAVNFEENGERTPINYVIPPGISQVIDPSNPHLTRLNEQAIVLRAVDLIDGDAKAGYKNADLDVRQYKKLQMEVHAEAITDGTLADGEARAFIRLGSDYQQNYYEYEVPLQLTLPGYYSNDSEADRTKVWPESNRFDFEFEVFQRLKQLRNAEARKEGSTIPPGGYMEMWEGNNRVTINGNPNLSDIRTIMIGIRNPKATNNPYMDDALPKSIEVWFNELRLTDFDEKGGWAANARIAARLADFGTVNISGQTSTQGFGSIEKKVNERQKEDIYQYDISSNLELGKFFPEAARISIPMYVGYSERFVNPEYSPLDPDIPLDVVLEDIENLYGRDSVRNYKKAAQDYEKRKSLNFTNVKINGNSTKPRPWSISNFGLNYGINTLESNNISTEVNYQRTWNTGLMYNFNTTPKSVTPFQKSKAKFLKSPWLRIIKDFNFNYVPNQISVRTDINRMYRETKLRDIAASDVNIEMPFTVKKDFNWNRVYTFKYDLTKTLKIDYSATNTSRIDEHSGRVYGKDDDGTFKPYVDEDNYSYEDWRDSILYNISQFGRNTDFRQNIGIQYNVPINKIPLFSWITSNVRYSGTYNWLAGPVDLDVGNTIKNTNTIQLNGQMNFLNLYNKVPYLKKINQDNRRGGRAAAKKPKVEKVRWPEKGREKISSLKKDQPHSISHKLETEDVQVKVYDDKGRPVKGETKIINENRVTFTSTQDVTDATVEVTGTKEIKESVFKLVMDKTLMVLMGVKNINGSYAINSGSMLPGYENNTTLFGLSQDNAGLYAPGFPYVFGYADERFGLLAGENDWLNQNDSVSVYEPYRWNQSKNFTLRSSIEPVPGMRIDVNSAWTKSENISYYLDQDPDGNFVTQGYLENGNFSMSFNTMSTAFNKVDKTDYTSEIFENFKENRLTIAERLAMERKESDLFNDDYGFINPFQPGTGTFNTDSAGFPLGYGATSKQVLIPAFIAAYTGQNPEDVDLNSMPNAISFKNGKFRLNVMPNWRITYDGLKNVKFLKKYFKTITIGHAYRSTYSVGSYSLNTYFRDSLISDRVNYALDGDMNFYGEFDINSVSISEQFSPLINIDLTWVNSVITKFEIKKSRNLALSFSNNWLTENTTREIVIGSGYRIKNVPLLINDKKYESDLNLKADLSFKNNLTVIRKISEGIDEPMSGQSDVRIKVTADYVMSDRFNIQLFYNRSVNKPKISIVYPRAETEFGVSVRFTLAQ